MSAFLLLDTSVVLNLLAAEVSEAILKALPASCLVCSAVNSEAIYIRGENSRQPPQLISIAPWLHAGVVEIVLLGSPAEEEAYVQFAADLGDGEAMSLAICSMRGHALATDDEKARRIASAVTPVAITLLSTADIIHHWATQAAPSPDELQRVLITIESRARFRPPSDEPLWDWWMRSR